MGMEGDVCDQRGTEHIRRLPFDAAKCAHCVRTTRHPRESQGIWTVYSGYEAPGK